jgi:SAM-dependent methyltransferase
VGKILTGKKLYHEPFVSGETRLKFCKFRFLFKPGKCPVCRSRNNRVFLKISDKSVSCFLLSCKCGTLFYPYATAPNYMEVEGRESFFMRLDQAEGIDSSLAPLYISKEFDYLPVVDVGCGLGFTSDFLRFEGRECVAFDPSSAAAISTEILGIDINIGLANAEKIQMSSDRLVFCSEVIEHVENPLEFLLLMKNLAGSEGYLIASTPNGPYISRKVPKSTIKAMVAPSQHLFLLSPAALEGIAKSAGFEWIHTWTSNERLFMVAGPRPVHLSGEFPEMRFMEYLKHRLNDDSISQLVRARSFGYRLFKELVNRALYTEADELWNEIACIYQGLGFDINNPVETVVSFRRGAKGGTILPEPENFPFNMATLFFLRATLLIAKNHDRVAAKPFFESSIDISRLYQKLFGQGIFQVYDQEVSLVTEWARKSLAMHG